MDAIAIVYTLTAMDIISEGNQNQVTAAPGGRQQNEILYGHLKRTCNREALVIVCKTMINAKGNPRMNSFGSDMLSKLSGKCYLCVHACMSCTQACVNVSTFA